ncbi:hypothetical protein HDV06_006576 [Boothiomyces sp. JEL0866]|nr:hypothetical protein HDV06_006576 [Boothiomyces sp. JEL0866]
MQVFKNKSYNSKQDFLDALTRHTLSSLKVEIKQIKENQYFSKTKLGEFVLLLKENVYELESNSFSFDADLPLSSLYWDWNKVSAIVLGLTELLKGKVDQQVADAFKLKVHKDTEIVKQQTLPQALPQQPIAESLPKPVQYGTPVNVASVNITPKFEIGRSDLEPNFQGINPGGGMIVGPDHPMFSNTKPNYTGGGIPSYPGNTGIPGTNNPGNAGFPGVINPGNHSIIDNIRPKTDPFSDNPYKTPYGGNLGGFGAFPSGGIPYQGGIPAINPTAPFQPNPYQPANPYLPQNPYKSDPNNPMQLPPGSVPQGARFDPITPFEKKPDPSGDPDNDQENPEEYI